MKPIRYAFIKANWHSEIVSQALTGFSELIPVDKIEIFDVPGAFEMPLLAKKLAATGQYSAVVAAALIVDGGIYRHDFVATAVINGLMQVSIESNVPVLSVALTPHNFQDNDHFFGIYREHFLLKGREAAHAAIMMEKVK